MRRQAPCKGCQTTTRLTDLRPLPGSWRTTTVSGGVVAALLDPRLMADIAPRCSWRMDRLESNEMRAIRTWRLPVVSGREETRGVLAVGQPYDETKAFASTARRLKNLQHQAKALNMTLVPA